MATIDELLDWGQQVLSSQEIPQLEAQILLAHVLETDRSHLYAWAEKEVPPALAKQYEALVARRSQNEPIAYIVGYKEFWSLPFEVTTDTLIPRAQTELLVQIVLNQLPTSEQYILDVGTGCGAIACALAHDRPRWQIVGIDISPAALEVAKRNAKRLHLTNVQFIESNWLKNLSPKQYDAIIGNPPYIKGGDLPLLHRKTFEPEIALSPGMAGLEAFQIILQQSQDFLKAHGLIAFEHSIYQAAELAQLFEQAGLKEIKTFQDNAGNNRVTIGKVK